MSTAPFDLPKMSAIHGFCPEIGALGFSRFFFDDRTAKKKAKEKRNRAGGVSPRARGNGGYAPLDRRCLAGAGVSGQPP